jgi:hypothetical protein
MLGCNGLDRRPRAPPERGPTSAWCGMARVYAESPQQEASKHAIRDYGFCGLPRH